MPYKIERKLVVGVASSTLFDLKESDEIYRNDGVDRYRKHQEANVDKPFLKGVAFPFIRRFLRLNQIFHDQKGPWR